MLYDLLLIFLIGSIVGWFLEIIWRNIFTKKNYNPGFLVGPYIPIYGFGSISLYLLYPLNVHILLKIFISGILLTIIELIGSLILLYVFGIRLWNYFKCPFNFKGHICLTYFFFWTVISVFFYLELYKLLLYILNILKNSNIKIFIILLYILFFVDLIFRIKKYILNKRKKN